MKRFFTVMVVLLVTTALFAGVTVKAGGTFGFDSYKSVAEGKATDGTQEMPVKFEDIGLADKALILKSKGFGFDVGVQYDITDKLLAYVDFNMLFPGDAMINHIVGADVAEDFPADVKAKYLTEDDKVKVYSLKGLIADLKEYIDEDILKDIEISTKFSFFSVSAGAAYKFDVNAVKLAVGGGVTLNKASAKFTMANKNNADRKIEAAMSFTTIGANVMVDAKYMVAQNIGVGVTLMPQIGLYNKAVHTEGSGDVKYTITASGFAVSFAMPITVGVSYTF